MRKSLWAGIVIVISITIFIFILANFGSLIFGGSVISPFLLAIIKQTGHVSKMEVGEALDKLFEGIMNLL